MKNNDNELNYMPIQSQKSIKYKTSTKNISRSNKRTRQLLFFALGLGVGVIAAQGIDKAVDFYNGQKIVSEKLEDYGQIVSENSYIIKNGDGTPKTVKGRFLTAIDVNGLADAIIEQLDNGANETGVIYGIYFNTNSPNEIDEFYEALERANISPYWATEHGYTGFDDKALAKDAETIYIAEYNYDKEIGNTLGGR